MLGHELRQRIEALVREPLFLVDVELTGDGRGRILRVVVDTDTGVTVEELARLNREIGRALDEDDPIAGSYRLDLCSPGLDRPLAHPRLLARAAGRGARVRVRVADPLTAPVLPSELTGRLMRGDAGGVEIEADGATVRVGWERIQSVHQVLDW